MDIRYRELRLLTGLGTPEEIRFVPMPKDPDADKYYLPANMDAYTLCKDAQNPEGAGAFMKCKLSSQILLSGEADRPF